MAEASKLTINEVVDQWLEITVDKLHNALDEYNIGKLDGDLWRSVMGQVVATGGDVVGVIVKFLQYGRFVDMRVGNGVPIGSDRARAKKPWYSKTKYRELSRFRELIAFNLVNKTVSEAESMLKNGMDLNFYA